MAKFFIHHPVFAMVISLVILIAGLVSIPNLPVAQYPDICPPVVELSTTYTGANAEVVEATVGAPIEQEVNGADQMLYMRSLCTDNGNYVLQVTFDLARDQDLAMVDVQNRLSKAQPVLPAEVTKYGITVAKKSTQNLVYITFWSEDGTRDNLFVSNYITINILDQLKRINGIGDVSMLGGKADYAMRLWAQPDKMSRMKITCDDIINTIMSQNVQAAAGAVGDPPQEADVAMRYPCMVKGRLTTPDEFANCVISTNSRDNSGYLRIKDVCKVELGCSDYSNTGSRNNKSAVVVAVYQQVGANSVELAKQIKLKMADLCKYFPKGMDYDILYDSTVFVTRSIEEVVQTLFEAIVLVLIVVLIFLGNFRATLVPIMAVPVSLVGTFAGFAALGFSINLLTMFALVLAVGIVVDDAIVVVEAVEVHIEEGDDPVTATEKAMDDVSGAVMAIALVLCAVFVPVAFMGGMTGVMYKQFAVTLAVSVLLSALVALTMTPALCAMLLRPRKEGKGPIAWFFGCFNKCFTWMASTYAFIVRYSIKTVIPSVILVGGVYAAAYYLMVSTPSSFIPNEDTGMCFVAVNLPEGAALSRTQAVVSEVEKRCLKHSCIDKTLGIVGYNILQSSASTSCGAVVPAFKDWSLRLDPKDQVNAFIAQMMKETQDIPEAKIICAAPPPVPGLSTTGGLTMEFQDRSGGEVANLARLSQQYCQDLMQNGIASIAYTFLKPTVPRLNIDVDRDKVIGLGMKLDSAFTAMQVNLGGYYINQYNQFGRTWRVYLQAESKYRRNPNDIGSIYVRTGSGSMVPLGNLCSVKEGLGPDVLIRYNLYRASEINVEPMPGMSTSTLMEKMQDLFDKNPELTKSYGYDWTGTAYQERLSSGSTTQILILGLVFVFLFLAAQYESWGIPFAVLLSMPTVVVGALIGVNIVDMDMNIYVQIGLLTLIGLSAKNAILIVEYAKTYYEGGMSLLDATVEAARVRFRPILMTSFAFIMGVVPLANAQGASAVCRRALGTSVMSGMLAATILGILVIPTLYVWVQGLVTFLTGDKRDPELVAAARKAKEEAEVAKKAAKAEKAAKDEKAAKNKAETSAEEQK